VELHLAGDGPMRRRWEKEAGKLRIAGRCTWHGWLPEDSTLAMMGECDVFAFRACSKRRRQTVTQALSLGLL